MKPVYLFKVLISLIPVLLIFWYYFRAFIFKRSKILSFAGFFWGVLSSVITIFFQNFYPPTQNHILRALVYAALTEEGIRFLFIAIMVYRSSSHFTVTEGIFTSVMIGLGFAFAENLHYAVNFTGNIIFLRTISSVAIHVGLSGIMGYMISYAYLNRISDKKMKVSRIFKWRNLQKWAFAFLFPWSVHAFYDWCLLSRSHWVYLVPIIVTSLFVYLEFLQDQGHEIFGKNVLSMLKITADDVMMLLRQQSYERWVSNRQKRVEKIEFLKKVWPLYPMSVILFFILLAGTFLYLIETNSSLVNFVADLDHSAKISLLVLYPLTVALIILLAVKINFSFFRILVSHVPQTVLVNVHPPDDEEESFTFVMDLPPIGVFLPIQAHWPKKSKLSMEFLDTLNKKKREKELSVSGTIIWSNQFNKTLPLGYICHFEHQPFRFIWFRFRYKWHKIRKVPTTYRKLLSSENTT